MIVRISPLSWIPATSPEHIILPNMAVCPMLPLTRVTPGKWFCIYLLIVSSYSLLCLFLMPSCSNWITMDSVHQFWLCYWDLIGCAGDRLGWPRGPFVRGPSVGGSQAWDQAWPRQIRGMGRDDRMAGWQDGLLPSVQPKPATPQFLDICLSFCCHYT